jgi:hypothetical protein
VNYSFAAVTDVCCDPRPTLPIPVPQVKAKRNSPFDVLATGEAVKYLVPLQVVQHKNFDSQA